MNFLEMLQLDLAAALMYLVGTFLRDNGIKVSCLDGLVSGFVAGPWSAVTRIPSNVLAPRFRGEAALQSRQNRT